MLSVPRIRLLFNRMPQHRQSEILRSLAARWLGTSVGFRRLTMMHNRQAENFIRHRIDAREYALSSGLPGADCPHPLRVIDCAHAGNISNTRDKGAFPVWTNGGSYLFDRSVDGGHDGYGGQGYQSMVGIDGTLFSDALLVGLGFGIGQSHADAVNDDMIFTISEAYHLPVALYGFYRLDDRDRMDFSAIFGYHAQRPSYYMMGSGMVGSIKTRTYSLSGGWKRDFSLVSSVDISARVGASWHYFDFGEYREEGRYGRDIIMHNLDFLRLSLGTMITKRFDLPFDHDLLPSSIVPVVDLQVEHDLFADRVSGMARFKGSPIEFPITGEDIHDWGISIGVRLGLELSPKQSLAPSYSFHRRGFFHSHDISLNWGYTF